MSQTTKKALAASLRKVVSQKPLDKITVTDIAEDCEVNRQTFYYHFQDIYDLLDWFFLNEASDALAGKKTYDTWQQGFLQIFEYVLENRILINHVYHSISREQVERYLYEVTYHLLIDVVEEQSTGILVLEEDKKFIADFYKYAFVGLMLDWIRTGMKESPRIILERLGTLIQGDISAALERFSTNARN